MLIAAVDGERPELLNPPSKGSKALCPANA
jgi:hypothetical protein